MKNGANVGDVQMVPISDGGRLECGITIEAIH